MRKHPYYSIFYINVARLLVQGIIPFGLLAYYNYNIYRQLKLVSNLSQDNRTRDSRYKQETDLARVLIVIVIAFVSCHALRIVLNFHEAVLVTNILECTSAGKLGVSMWVLIMNNFSELMLVINSSVNVIIYCCLNKSLWRRPVNNDAQETTLPLTSNYIEMEEHLTRET